MPTNTDGWKIFIGKVGKSDPRLEIWLDRFAGYPKRTFCICFGSNIPESVKAITDQVSRKLFPVRTVSMADVTEGRHFLLTNRLPRSEFNTPILELYGAKQAFYGIYSRNGGNRKGISAEFCNRAIGFVEDVIAALADDDDVEIPDIYPQIENRKRVVSHLQRERSRLLAAECKIRDHYRCRVCNMQFDAVYGTIGKNYAEAHHTIPLSQLRSSVRTRLEDLRTVCSNCHRMLHRMEGKRDDIQRLKERIRRAAQDR